MSDAAQSEGRGTTERPALSVVVVAYESADAFRLTLPAVVAELEPGDELIVCDNGSTDETIAVVRELAPEAILLEAGANLGFAGRVRGWFALPPRLPKRRRVLD